MNISNATSSDITTTERVLIILCSLVTLLTIVDFVEKVSYVLRQYQTSKAIMYKTIHVLGTYPAVSLASLVALFIPRSSILCQLMSSVYISRCMYIFITMMVMYFGGSKKMLQRLRHVRIVLRSPPCCCCCCCLPTLSVNLKNICLIKVLVLQNAIVQPLMTFITMVLWIDGKYQDGEFSLNNSFPYLNMINVTSTMFGFYGFLVFFKLCRDHLKPVLIVPKFFALQLVIICRNLQGLVFSILAKFGIPPCEGVLSSNIRAEAYLQMVLVLEMFLLAMLARHVYRRPSHDLSRLSIDEEDTKEFSNTNCFTGRTESDMPVWIGDMNTITTQPEKDKM